MANPYQFNYPTTGWSTGKMRKRGDQTAWLPESMRPGGDPLDPSRGKGLFGGGGGGGLAVQPIQEQLKSKLAPKAADAIQEQIGHIKNHLNEISVGDATMGGLKKLMKKFGWTGDPEKGVFTDPEGKTHNITADQDANSPQGSDAAGPRR